MLQPAGSGGAAVPRYRPAGTVLGPQGPPVGGPRRQFGDGEDQPVADDLGRHGARPPAQGGSGVERRQVGQWPERQLHHEAGGRRGVVAVGARCREREVHLRRRDGGGGEVPHRVRGTVVDELLRPPPRPARAGDHQVDGAVGAGGWHDGAELEVEVDAERRRGDAAEADSGDPVGEAGAHARSPGRPLPAPRWPPSQRRWWARGCTARPTGHRSRPAPRPSRRPPRTGGPRRTFGGRPTRRWRWARERRTWPGPCPGPPAWTARPATCRRPDRRPRRRPGRRGCSRRRRTAGHPAVSHDLPVAPPPPGQLRGR